MSVKRLWIYAIQLKVLKREKKNSQRHKKGLFVCFNCEVFNNCEEIERYLNRINCAGLKIK